MDEMIEGRVLYVFDDSAEPGRRFKRQRIPLQAQVLLCPITVDESKKAAVVEELKRAGYGRIKLLDYISEFNRISFVERDTYIRFIADTGNKVFHGGKSLKEYFKCPRGGWSFWWQSLVVEKNPMKSAAFSNLIKLRTILKFQKEYCCKKIVINIGNKEVSRALSDNAKEQGYLLSSLQRCKRFYRPAAAIWSVIKTFVYLIRIFYRYLAVKILLGRLASPQNNSHCRYYFITPFPFVDETALRKKTYRDRFFSHLQKELEERGGKAQEWLGLVTVADDSKYISALRLARKIKKWGNPLHIDAEYLGLKGCIFMASLYACICWRYISGLADFIKKFRYRGGEKVWNIFREEWMKSFCGTTLVDNLFYYVIFKNVFAGFNKKTAILYISENQGWEKMLNIAAKEAGGLKTIGYQHTSVRRQMLNCYNHYSEFQGSGHVQALPVPDYLGCVGDITAQVSRECGWDKNRIFVWGAMRYCRLKSFIEDFPSWEKRENSVLVALALEEKEAKETLFYAYHAFKGQKGIKIFIKGHYASPAVDEICAKFSLKLDYDIFEVTEAPLEKLLEKVKAVVVNSSTVALEAIAAGCSVIVPRLVNTVDISPLTGFSSLGTYVSSPFELRARIYDIMSARQEPALRKQGTDFIKRYFYFLEDNETFLSRLESMVFSKNN